MVQNGSLAEDFFNVWSLVISQRYCCCVALGRLLICVCSLVISHLHSWFVVYGSISEELHIHLDRTQQA